MIQHEPWIGKHFRDVGIKGQRIAIVGYSHWAGENGKDGSDFTTGTLESVISGEEKIAFFSSIRNYFSFSSHVEFWPRVMFFNYLPNYVGGAEDRFATGTSDQITVAKERFLRLLRAHAPEKVIVLSRKGWSQLPSTSEEEKGNDTFLLWQNFSDFRWGTYKVGRSTIKVFGLRHPQGAPFGLMSRAIETIINQ